MQARAAGDGRKGAEELNVRLGFQRRLFLWNRFFETDAVVFRAKSEFMVCPPWSSPIIIAASQLAAAAADAATISFTNSQQ